MATRKRKPDPKFIGIDYRVKGREVPLDENLRAVRLSTTHLGHPEQPKWIELSWDDTYSMWRIRGSDCFDVQLDSGNTIRLKTRGDDA
jgi:hypothetical protein